MKLIYRLLIGLFAQDILEAELWRIIMDQFFSIRSCDMRRRDRRAKDKVFLYPFQMSFVRKRNAVLLAEFHILADEIELLLGLFADDDLVGDITGDIQNAVWQIIAFAFDFYIILLFPISSPSEDLFFA